MRFDADIATQVSDGLQSVFLPLRSVFESAKQMVIAAGDNALAVQMTEHFKKLEGSFNNTIPQAFSNLKADISQHVENLELFEKAMAGYDTPVTSDLDNADQGRHTQAFNAL